MDCVICGNDGYMVYEDKVLCYNCYIKRFYGGNEKISSKSQNIKYIRK